MVEASRTVETHRSPLDAILISVNSEWRPCKSEIFKNRVDPWNARNLVPHIRTPYSGQPPCRFCELGPGRGTAEYYEIHGLCYLRKIPTRCRRKSGSVHQGTRRQEIWSLSAPPPVQRHTCLRQLACSRGQRLRLH